MEKKSSKNNKILWSIIFMLIAGLTVWAVIRQSGTFSFSGLIESLQGPRVWWLAVAVACVGMYVWLEGAALLRIHRSFGIRGKVSDGLLYSSADIYCSAITPSATGGQPASAYFMMKNGVPGTVATVSLLLNLIMYTISIVVIGVLCLLFKHDILLSLDLPAQLLIYVGVLVQTALALVFVLLLWKEKLLWILGDSCLRLLGWLHLLRRSKRKRVKLRRSIKDYRDCTRQVAGQHGMLIGVFIYNLLQRIVLILITGLVHLALGGDPSRFIDVCALQSFVVLGAAWIPIPGAMGVTDYLLLAGLGGLVGEATAVNMELCSRGISFYACVLLCGTYVLAHIIKNRMRKCKK